MLRRPQERVASSWWWDKADCVGNCDGKLCYISVIMRAYKKGQSSNSSQKFNFFPPVGFLLHKIHIGFQCLLQLLKKSWTNSMFNSKTLPWTLAWLGLDVYLCSCTHILSISLGSTQKICHVDGGIVRLQCPPFIRFFGLIFGYG